MSKYAELNRMPADQRHRAIGELISGSIHEIADDPVFCHCIASTNTETWEVDDYELDEADFDDQDRSVRVPLSYHATGDQDEDAFFQGNTIDGNAVAVIHNDGRVTFDELTAEVISGEDDEGDADESEQ